MGKNWSDAQEGMRMTVNSCFVTSLMLARTASQRSYPPTSAIYCPHLHAGYLASVDPREQERAATDL